MDNEDDNDNDDQMDISWINKYEHEDRHYNRFIQQI